MQSLNLSKKSFSPLKSSRKRKTTESLQNSPSLKLTRLPSQDSLQSDGGSHPSSAGIEESEVFEPSLSSTIATPNNACQKSQKEDQEDCSNFRRFSTRDRKRTDFFTPPSGRDSSNEMESSKRTKSNFSETARRALQFDVWKPQDSTPLSSSSSTGPTTDGDQRCSGGLPSSTPQKRDRAVLREPVVKGNSSSATESSLTGNTNNSSSSSNGRSPPLPLGTLVWGKLPGYDWWPGCVISYDKKELDKFREEMDNDDELETGPMEEEDEGDIVTWVKWFGDNQLSLLSCRKLRNFCLFVEYFSPSKLKGLYKRALFASLREAAKRCHLDAAFKHEDKKPSWVFHSLACNQLTKKNQKPVLHHSKMDENEVSAIDTASPKPEPHAGSESEPHTGSESIPEIFTLCPSMQELGEGGKEEPKRRGKERGTIYLTGVEKELLEWAMNGFLPTGPQGFKPRPEHLLDVKIVPVESSLDTTDTTYSPSNRGDENGRSRKTGRRGSGTGMEKDKLIVIETRNKAQFELVLQGQIDIEDICIGCGRSNIVAEHPLFHGGLCKFCKDMFMECAYLFDDDGTQMYCTICSAGNEVFMCDTPNCSKVYCGTCIEKLCGESELGAVKESDKWQCYMCSSDKSGVGLMKKREDWDKKLHDLFLNDNEIDFEPPRFYPPVTAEDRRPIRVLGLFDGIGTGLLVLKELGIEVDIYVASEIDGDALKVSRVNHGEMIHVGAVEYITEKEIKAWGPFDLVMGGSPCNDLSIVNPARKGIYDGTGRLFFEFFRILSYAKPSNGDPRAFFWLYENVVSMRAVDKQIISRFLQCNPVVVDARDISAAHRARFFWGNLPGMNRPTVPLPGDRLSLQDCLEPNCFRTAQFTKLRTVTTKMNSIKQTKKAILPVRVPGENHDGEEEEGDVLWCTEMERLFGFPVHYTDVGNLGRCGRQRLLGKAWSVPVVRHLLSPLKDYFKSRTTGIPASQKFGTSTEDDSLPVLTSNGDSLTPPSLSTVTPAEAQLADAEMINIRMTANGAYQANESGSNN